MRCSGKGSSGFAVRHRIDLFEEGMRPVTKYPLMNKATKPKKEFEKVK